MFDRWILLTAGLGSKPFESAAQRVLLEGNSLHGWEKQIALNFANLNEYCPTSVKNYSHILMPETTGFGYMSWKAEIVYRALNNDFGPCDGVVWVDAGCEVVSNPLSRYILKRRMGSAKRYGAAIFTLDTPEMFYTKHDLFAEFPLVSDEDITPQIQTTNFYLYGDVGLKIAKRWHEVASKSEVMIDESESKFGEVGGFINHRHDQSVFSLCCKSEKSFHEFKPLTTGTGGYRAKLRGFGSPFWAARNRTGVTYVPRWFNF